VHHLGSTRSSVKPDHILQTPDTFVRCPLPGADGVEFIIHAAPQLGASFTQMTAEFAPGGCIGASPAQRFVYVLDGTLQLTAGNRKETLNPAGFAYLPNGTEHTLRASEVSRAVIIEKPYQSQPNAP